jgi:hypothetical protein
MFLDTGMRATRVYTPTNMRMVATSYTGVEYKRSEKGLRMALQDLAKIYEEATGRPYALTLNKD